MSMRVAVAVVIISLSGCASKRSFPTSVTGGEALAESIVPDGQPAMKVSVNALLRSYTMRSTELYVRAVDVGAGLCLVALTPDGHTMVYDAGHWGNDYCSNAVGEVLGENGRIDLLILSHGDADHLGEVPVILKAHDVDIIIWTGDKRDSAAWKAASKAIGNAAARGTTVYSLQTYDIQPGTEFPLGGQATVSMIAGWGESPWVGLDPSDTRNVISIVARLKYGKSSLLLTGDTIGRNRNSSNEVDECASAEQFMVQNRTAVPIKSTVMTAPHHGGNNGSAACFVRAVSPQWVIFSSGHEYRHPRELVAARYIDAGVNPERMLRTDRGDNEGGEEWAAGANTCADDPGDDDIEIMMSKSGAVSVVYAQGDVGC